MIPDPTETKDDGFQLDAGQSPPRYPKKKRKKPALVVWVSGCAILGLVVALAGLGWGLLSGDSGSLTILPISDPVIRQGDVLRMQIPVRRVGREPGQLTYSLSDAPPEATIDGKTGDFCWPTAETHNPGTYRVIVKVLTAGRRPLSDERTFAVVLLKKPPQPARKTSTDDGSALPAMAGFVNPLEQMNPFEITAALTPHGKIDEFVFDKLKQLKIEPAHLCSDGVFLRRVYLDTIGTLPTAEEAKSFLDDKAPNKRSALIDRLLERPEFADYWAMKWSDLLRVKAEFPINLWPNGAQRTTAGFGPRARKTCPTTGSSGSCSRPAAAIFVRPRSTSSGPCKAKSRRPSLRRSPWRSWECGRRVGRKSDGRASARQSGAKR